MKFPKKFFFVDDDADDREFLCSTMQEIEPTVECHFAKDGISAIAQLEQNTQFIPDYIFIDMNMPMMDGRECLTKIRQLSRLNDTEVYIYSTAITPKLNQEVMALGATGILEKPSTVNDLSRLLQQVLN